MNILGKFTLTEDEQTRQLTSKTYNYIFLKTTKQLLRWGTTPKENPAYAPYGPDYIVVDVAGMPVEQLLLIIKVMQLTGTLAFVIIVNCSPDKMEKYKMCVELQGLECIFKDISEVENEFCLFSAFITGFGDVYTSPNGKLIANVSDVKNLLRDVWYSLNAVEYRYDRLRGQNEELHK